MVQGSRDVQAAYVIGMLHWVRYHLLPAGADQVDLSEALIWFGRVLPWEPDEVPAPVMSSVARLAPRSGEQPNDWNAEAVRLLQSAAASAHVEVLDRAIVLLAEAVDAASNDDPDRFQYLSNLGVARFTRFERIGDMADLDQAILVGGAAVAAAPPDHPNRAATLANLSNAWRARSQRSGDLSDLDQAILVGQAAVDAISTDHPDRAATLVNLGLARRARFERIGDLADLDRAILLGQAGVDATPIDHPSRACRLSNLSVARL
jgi:hypothetical protein